MRFAERFDLGPSCSATAFPLPSILLEACGDTLQEGTFLSLSKLSMSKIVGDMQHEKEIGWISS